MVHVDDIILVCGNRSHCKSVFLVKFAGKFKVSHSELEGMGSEISFPECVAKGSRFTLWGSGG